MSKLRSMNPVFWVLVLAALFLGGCGYAIKYNLNEKDIFLSESTKPLKVQFATFSDMRDVVEREKSARKQEGYTDLGDYTYDKEFRGDVAEEITKMSIKHLNYSKVFSYEITPASFGTEQPSAEVLDSLGEMGIDAVITGEINHFYGYYDQSLGRQLLYGLPLAVASGLLLTWTTTSGNYQTTYYWYGPGLVLGGYLESLHERIIRKHVQMRAILISTTTHQPFWEDSFEISSTEKRSMPGLSTSERKFQVTVWSLREAVNQMVKSIERATLSNRAE